MPDESIRIEVPIVVRNKSLFGIGGRDINVRDVRALQRKLKEIDPDLRKQLMRDAKSIGQDADNQVVKPALRSIMPLSGMTKAGNTGRMAWNYQRTKSKRIAYDATKVEFRTSTGTMARKFGIQKTTLVRIRVIAPMTVISDIAGRSNKATGKGYKGSGYTREFQRNGATVRMRLNGQGEAMISRLGGRGSRYVWPNLIGHKDRLERSVREVLMKYEAIANRKFD